MPGFTGRSAEDRRSLGAVIAAMAVVNLVYGLSFPLMALALAAEGVDETLIGISTMAQAGSVLVIAPLAPRLMRALGPARLMQAASLLLTLLFLALPAFPGFLAWLPLRFLIGAVSALLWIASEAMINELTQESRRGRVIALYSACGAAGYSLGPLILIATGSSGWTPFAVTSALIATAALPLFLATEARSAVPDERPPGIARMVLLAPAIMLANLVFAASIESIGTFFPLFGLALGLDEPAALGLMTVMGLGGIVLVLPLGWLADRVDRLGLMVACVTATALGLLIMPEMVGRPLAAPLYCFLLGGFEAMIYTLGVTLIGERFRGPALAAASTAYTAMWGAGTVIGPPLVGASMDLFGPAVMPWAIAAIFAAYLPVALAGLRHPARRASSAALSSPEEELPK